MPKGSVRLLPAIAVLGFISVVLFLPVSAIAADGTFQGKVVDPPPSEQVPEGWIFIQGGNHMLRRVDVSHAVVVLGPDIPSSQRRKCGWECLAAGQEIRVTAEQDSAGEWRAKRIVILRLPTTRTATSQG
jgi:hypothetical protein